MGPVRKKSILVNSTNMNTSQPMPQADCESIKSHHSHNGKVKQFVLKLGNLLRYQNLFFLTSLSKEGFVQ